MEIIMLIWHNIILFILFMIIK